MTVPPATKLAQIETMVDAKVDGGGLVTVPADTVLALVGIAEAVKDYIDAEEADEAALGEVLDDASGDPNHHERLQDRQKETRRKADAAYDALRAELARLDGAK